MRHTFKPAETEFDIVAYGKTSKLTLEKGVKIDEIILEVQNVDLAQLKDISLTLDGDPKFNVEYTRINDLHKYLARTVSGNTTFYSIPFADFSAKSIEGQEQSGLQILNENAVFKVTLGAATGAQTTAGDVPGMSAHIVYGLPTLNEKGELTRITTPMLLEDTISIKKVGENSYHGFEAASPLGVNYLQRAVFYGGNITKIEAFVKDINGRHNKKAEMTKALCEYLQQRQKRTPIAGAMVFDPLLLGFNRADLLNPEFGVQFKIHTDSADNVEVVYQTLQVSQ